jgi:diguanylate cyclase (GGDEF)-like protein
MTCVAGLFLLWFGLDEGGQQAQVIVGWSAVTLFTAARPVFSFRVVRMLPPADPDVHFWRALGGLGCVVAAGSAIQLMTAVADPLASASLTGGPFAVGSVAISTLGMVLVMFRYPLGLDSPRERTCFWLDLATVVAGVAPFAWYFALSGATSGSQSYPLEGGFAALGGSVLILVSVFAVVKLSMVGTAPFCLQAGFVGGIGVTLIGLGSGAAPALVASGHGNIFFMLTVLGHASLPLAARTQERYLRARLAPAIVRRRRQHRPLPYLAIAATNALLTVLLIRHDTDARIWGVLAGSVGSTALVVIRQLVTFAENARLLEALRSTEAALRHQAFHDSLTGLANRALFADRLGQELIRARRDRQPVVVMLLDLDNFKPVNDQRGHHTGDLVLQEVASRLRGCLREIDTAARIGGDEFAILLAQPHLLSMTDIAEQVVAALNAPCVLLGEQIRIKASIGISIDPHGQGNSDEILRNADDAMYAAKRRGRGGFIVCSESVPQTCPLPDDSDRHPPSDCT